MIVKKVFCVLAIVAATFAAGCAVGPPYARPSAPTPTAWKSQAPWEQAAPKDSLSKGPWWEIFGDPQLNEYEKQLLAANQSLVASRDRLEQARSLARVATAGLFPQVSTDPGVVHQRVSGNRVSATLPTTSYTATQYSVPFALNYEVDLFGRVRKNVQAANQNLQANAADLQNVQLVLTAELAADYFTLHELDAEYQVVQENVGYQRKGLDLVNRRHQGGVASGLEVAQQAALLDATLTQLSLIEQTRAQYEHAIAVLVGQPASNFAIAAAPLRSNPPTIPLGVPSDVLERRPDIATAERLMAFQNSQVGIARTAFFPHITLSGQGGLVSRSAGDLFSASSVFWAVGSDALQPIFQGGRNRANLAAARSAYDEAVANYRQTVLTSFQQVEDGISSLNSLAQAAATQAAAVQDARKQLEFANNRYVGGVTTYLDVITAQSVLLNDERLAAQLLGQQMVTSVFLVKALGGGWDAKLIDKEQVHPQAIQAVQP
jgi:multidrug efflux system outer membrane protein